MFVPDLLSRGVTQALARACVTLDGTTLTFADVDDRASRLAQTLIEVGVTRGDRVMLIAKNELEFLEIQVACQRAGASLVAVNFRLAPAEVVAIVSDCAPAVLITGPGFEKLGAGISVRIHFQLGVDGSYEERLSRTRPLSRVHLDGDAIAQIAYTSGTTGAPKGAQITNATLFGRIASLTTGLDIDVDDVFLQTLPLFHLASLVSFAYTISACPVVIVRDFDPADTLWTISMEKVTRAIMVPTIISALVEARGSYDGDLGSLRTVYYGASPIAPVVLDQALSTFECEMAQFYGMTEAGIATLLGPADHTLGDESRLRAAGQPLPFYELMIRRPDGQPAAVGEVGEIAISGPGLMHSYRGNPDATAAALVDGYLLTGDAGYVDDEGYLFVSDRVKDMIITGGENVFCREVEAALLAHPDVADAAVIGLADERWGQRVHALIVETSAIDDGALDEWCRQRIAGYKCPRSFERVEELPRNAVGKILKHVLRADREAGSLG
ncbi:AMP-binding protein [Gordonia sp. TBRC 11910]|uniref:AMP-binding protein n=1 Tax=Gordonia asplenii TaxID=2725283 RepID=A0A848KYZ7_9ACTN|nr:AMP-binding protein [Gordonia asplenii]NMO01421.1 AMP-binding protein [Gordonia asplenii]